MYKILYITAVFLVCFVIQDNDARRIFSLSRHRQSKPDNISLTVSLYYESLCPDCVQFSKQQLCPLWEESRLSDYFKIEFVPYGNAEVSLATKPTSIEVVPIILWKPLRSHLLSLICADNRLKNRRNFLSLPARTP